MAIYVEINPREREATLRSAHSLCAGESAEVVLSGIPDADTETLSLRLYRDRSEAEFVAAARRPGDADPPQEGFVAVQGRAAMRRAVLDLRSESVASWASDVFDRSESESDDPKETPKPPETAWMVVADVSRVWAACEVPFLLRPMSPESADVALTLPLLVERAAAAAESAERSAEAASASALEASRAAERAAAATDGKADLVDGKVPASQLPSYVDDVLEYDSRSAFPGTGESGKIYVDRATNAVYRWSGSAYVEVSPSRDWTQELAAKEDKSNKTTSLSTGSTDVQYPSAKAVFDALAGKQATLEYDAAPAHDSAKHVKSGGIWGAIWGALSALPTGFSSLYDWVVAQLADYLPLAGGTLTGELAIGPNQNYSAKFESDVGGGVTLLLRDTIGNKLYLSGGKLYYQQYNWQFGVELFFPSRDGTLAIAAPNPTAGHLAALDENGNPTDSGQKPSDFASAADLRYRIAAPAVRWMLPAYGFPVTFTHEGVSYSGSSLVEESEASAAGDMFIMDDATTGYQYLIMVASPATESEAASLIDVAQFNGGVFVAPGVADLEFGGFEPVVNTLPTLTGIRVLADRAVNLITANVMETSIDIELPAAVTVDGVRRARDFLLDVDNSINGSDLALEFTGLGVDYAFMPLEGDSAREMMTIGAGERVRLYFTEAPYTASPALPVINVARVTLGDFVTA